MESLRIAVACHRRDAQKLSQAIGKGEGLMTVCVVRLLEETHKGLIHSDFSAEHLEWRRAHAGPTRVFIEGQLLRLTR
jgi:hypothetical protein